MNSPIDDTKKETKNLLMRYLKGYENDQLFTANQDAIFTVDLNGYFVQVNESFEKLLGYSNEETKQIKCQSIVVVEEADKFLTYFHQSASGQFHTFDCKFRNKKEQIIDFTILLLPISVDNQMAGIKIVAKRKKTEVIKSEAFSERENELWNRKKTFRNFIEYAPDAIIISKQEKIIFINESGIKLLNAANMEEVMSRTILELVHPDYHQLVKERIKNGLNGKVTKFNQFVLMRFDGTSLDAEAKVFPAFFNNESGQHIIIIRDITERKKTQELLHNSEKLTIAGQLAAGIAHEVRNPLTAIKGFLQLMERQIANKRYFDIIQSEINRIELILSELLVLAKPQDLKFEKEKMKALVEEVKTLIDTQAIMNDIQIEIVNKCEDVTINCDKNQLKQVFINFLKNSIEAMPNGGNITIKIKKLSDNKVRIFFKDTGYGIPQHILKRIGEPFFTTKENGSGLGVMISKQIIDNHNGSVKFWSDPNGTLIEVILPL